jgi:hypothetical protein
MIDGGIRENPGWQNQVFLAAHPNDMFIFVVF